MAAKAYCVTFPGLPAKMEVEALSASIPIMAETDEEAIRLARKSIVGPVPPGGWGLIELVSGTRRAIRLVHREE